MNCWEAETISGFVKFYRKIGEWTWYTDVNTFKLFFHLITFANYTDGEVKGVKIKRGQIARTLKNLASETGLTVSEVRTALSHLEKTENIARYTHGKIHVVTVKNCDMYQGVDTNFARSSHVVDTNFARFSHRYKNNKKYKNKKNIKEREEDMSSSPSEEKSYPQPMGGTLGKGVLLLTEEQTNRLLDMMPVNVFDKYCDKLSTWIKNNRPVTTSHFELIKKWYSEDYGG